MVFIGGAHSEKSDYFENKLRKAREKLKEFPNLLSMSDNFKNANRKNHTENVILNFLSASVSDPFLNGGPNLKCADRLKNLDLVLGDLIQKLSKKKKQNLIRRLNLFGKNHFETINELWFYIDLSQNESVSDINYENGKLGNHDFNFKLDGEEFNLELTSLGKSQIQQILEKAFSIVSEEILNSIPQKKYLQLTIVTDRILKEKDNCVKDLKKKILEDYHKIEDLILVDMDGLCILERNLGNPDKDLYSLKELYGYYREFGERLEKLSSSEKGISFLKKTKIKDITENSIRSFIVGNAKFGGVEIHSQCQWPSRAESLRKISLTKQLKRRIKEKIDLGQLKGKKTPLIAINFEDFLFMHYSSEEDIWCQENFNELKMILEEVFTETGDNEILGVLMYENSLEKAKFLKNPNIKIEERILNKIKLLENAKTKK